jgi:hypothetical protein
VGIVLLPLGLEGKNFSEEKVRGWTGYTVLPFLMAK